MIEPHTWFNENGAKLCDRWRDSDRPLAATIIQFGAFTALLAPDGTAVVPHAAQGVVRMPYGVEFPPARREAD
jgi:hypothetical protein